MGDISRRDLIKVGLISVLGLSCSLEQVRKCENVVYIPELDVKVRLKPNNLYIMEFVKDVNERVNEIISSHSFVMSMGAAHYEGIYLPMASPGKLEHYVLIDKDNDDKTKLGTICHENGHFIWSQGEADVIFMRSRDPPYVKSQVKGTEDFAILCGWLGLKMHGYELNKLYGVTPREKLKDRVDLQKRIVIEYF